MQEPARSTPVRIALALVPAVALAAVALWSTCRVAGAGDGVPGDGAWKRASALVRETHQPGDLIVFAPRWIDPVGRLHLGDLLPIDAAARLDAGRYGVIWELSVRGARAPETRGLTPAWQRDVGGVTVRRFERPPATLVTDVVATAGALIRDGRLPLEGLVARTPAVVLAEVGFEPHRCLQVVPSPGATVTITLPDVALGTELVGGVGLADIFKRREIRAPGELAIAVGNDEVARVVVGVDDGWRTFRAATTPGPATLTITVAALDKGARDRLVCFALEARTAAPAR
ncbi:MAG TPA: hypothetical protein VM734_22755 [Kofleriaceae bacterium]|nr:hypothetical protein [Kofleriaceae bacterium]